MADTKHDNEVYIEQLQELVKYFSSIEDASTRWIIVVLIRQIAKQN